MKSIVRLCGGFLVFILLFTAPPSRMINAQNDDEKENVQKCCFTNPQYAGVCEVNPAEGETCATILDYLNNPNSAGKTYCESTRIRVGWKQADCEKKAETTRPKLRSEISIPDGCDYRAFDHQRRGDCI